MAFADLTDVRCYFELLGDGPPLLLLPGLGKTCRLWDDIAPDLAKDFTLIMPDLRGTGRSKEHRPATHLSHYAADLIELLDVLQLEQTHVLGLSMGGIIAQRLAVDHSPRICRLVLVSCTDRFTPFLQQQAHLLGHVLRKFPRHVFAQAIEIMGTSPKYFDDHAGEIEERLLRCEHEMPKLELARQLRCLACSQIKPDHYQIDAPTLIIAGECDSLIPSCYGRAMADRIPGAQFELIPGVGHNPFEEVEQQAVELVVSFLKSRAPSPTEEAICP